MRTLLMTSLALVMLMAGCSMLNSNSSFDKNGLPRQKYFVGKPGVEFDYSAFCNGNIYIVEENSQKIFMTQSVDKDDSFDFSIGDMHDLSSDEIEQLKSIGIDPEKIEFSFYFIPAAIQTSADIE